MLSVYKKRETRLAEEQGQVPLVTGCQFLTNPTVPGVGILRLNTRGEPIAVAINKAGLLELAKACQIYADGLQDA